MNVKEELLKIWKAMMIDDLKNKENCISSIICGNILATENQQAIINDVIDEKIGANLHKT